jgi:hypothetical protein
VGNHQQSFYPWAAATGGEPEHVAHLDHADSFYPWQVYLNETLREGHLPFWNPYSFGGHPFFANGQSGVLYPARLALSLVVSPARVHDLLLLTHFALAGMAMFLFLGVVRLSFPAALVGGLVWMLNSFALSWQGLEHYVVIGAWLPIGFLLAHVAVSRGSWPASLGLALVLGLLVLGGNVLFVELAVVAIFAYAVVLVVAKARRDRHLLGGNVARLSVAAALLAGLSAVTSLPVVALAAASNREPLSYTDLAEFALPWSGLTNLVYPVNVWAGEPYNSDLFAGSIVPLLAIVALWRRELLPRFAVGLGTLTLLFMLHTPVTYVVSQVLPGFENFKPLPRAAFLLQFALAVLAAFGLETAIARMGSSWGRRLVRTPALKAGLVAAVVGWAALLLVASWTRFGIGLGIAALIAIALVLLRRTSDASSASLVSVVVVAGVAGSLVAQGHELGRTVMRHQPADSELLYPSTPLIGYLQDRDARFVAARPAFRGSTAMAHSLGNVGGYESLLPQRTETFWRVVAEGLTPQDVEAEPLTSAYHPFLSLSYLRPDRLARAAVAYVVAPPAAIEEAPPPAGLVLGYEGRDGRIFAVAGALPRARVVTGCEDAPSPQAALERFLAPDFAPSGSVILERRAATDGRLCGSSRAGRAGSATLAASSSNELVARVRADRPGWLVVSDTWDEDWRATVDGVGADVLPGDYASRAVRVPAGSHTIRFTYEPGWFRLGAAISAVSLAVTLGGLAFALSRGRTGRSSHS